MLSICLYTPCCPPTIGGAQTMLDELARRLLAAGHRVVVVAPAPREPWDDGRLGYPVVRHRRPWSKRFAVRAIVPRLAALHLRHRFDVLHCHSSYPHAYVAATMRRLFRLPYVVRPHGSDILPDEVIRSSARLDRRMRRGLTAADAVIAQGDAMREVIAAAGVSPERIHVITNGVDVTAFAAAERFPHPRPYLLGLGSLVPHKGFDLLVRAYAALPPSGHDLLIAGAGPEAAALADLAHGLGVADCVRFLGVVTGPRKVSLYRSATAFVCPSRREPFANVILEAFASGVPVVATDVGGNRELLQGGASGVLCPPESPAGLAAALGGLLAAPDRLAALRAASAAAAVRHDWSAVADRYAALYAAVAAA